MRFTEWKEAHNYATEIANRDGLDVAIRRTKEFGKSGFNVSYACKNDSDYARAEIVKAGIRAQANNGGSP